MHKYLVVAVLALVGCAGNTPKSMPDAALGSNLPCGAKCQIASDMSTECTSGVCTNSFDMLGYSICSQKCTMLMAIDPTCPAGTSQMCNKKGYCKP